MFLTKRFGAFILVCFIAALLASIVLVRADDSAAAAAVPAATPTPAASAVTTPTATATPTAPATPTAAPTATTPTAPATPTAAPTATTPTAPSATAIAVATPAPLRREGLIAPAAPEPSEATDLTAPPAPGLVLDDVQSQPTAEPEPTPALAPTAAPVLAPTAAPTVAPTAVVAAPWHVRRGEAALAQIPFNLSSLGYTISFHPERSSHRGLTFTRRNHIEIYVRATMSDAELVYVIAHEMGHAADVMRTSYADRDAWFSARGIPRTTAWWPSGIGNDLATPAGDFAECFASWAVGSASHSHYGSCAGTGPLVQQIIAQ